MVGQWGSFCIFHTCGQDPALLLPPAFLLLSKLCGQGSNGFPTPEFKFWCGSPSLTPFPTPPTVDYTYQQSGLLPFSAAIVSPGKLGPGTQS